MPQNEKVLVAKILSSKGLKGEVKLQVYTEFFDSLLDYNIFDKNENIFQIERITLQCDHIVAKFKGIDDVDKAKELNGIHLYTSRDNLPEIDEEDEYYLIDLVGLNVLDDNNTIIAKVLSVENFGAGDIVEIQYTADNKKQMIPFTKACVPEVNIKDGYIKIAISEIIADERLENDV